jgi:hypothetical protein
MRKRFGALLASMRARANRSAVTTFGEYAGAATVTVGAWDIYRPAGLIVGGAFVAFFSWLVGE